MGLSQGLGAAQGVPVRRQAAFPGIPNAAMGSVMPPTMQIVAPQRARVPPRSRAPRVCAQATSAQQGATLPWQVAMSEVKKRRDIKKVMIIGAGPIVIGQVGLRGPVSCPSLAQCHDALLAYG